jgi:hypothetical protein
LYDNEQVYDEKIYPLMAEVINICKDNDIQILFSCYLRTDDDGDLRCTTYLESIEQNCESLKDANKIIQCGYVATRPYVMSAMIASGKSN